MELKLSSVASLVGLIAAWAYSLGWIKSHYYYSVTIGVGLERLELTPQDYLFASWYTVENVMFLVLLLWIALFSRRLWPWIFALVYLPLPYFTDASYSYPNNFICAYLVRNPHGLLKFLPFVLLILLVVIHRDSIELLKASAWNHGNFALAFLAVVVIAWSISTAKHIGSSDAKRDLKEAETHLMHVRIHFNDASGDLKPIESQTKLYMLFYGPKHCIVLDLADYNLYQKQVHVRVLDIPSDSVRLVDGTFEIPGAGVLI